MGTAATMENKSSSARQGNAILRHLSNLKLVSRLLGHELHSQGAAKTINLSRDEVLEIQNTIDLFIEECSRRQGVGQGPTGFSEASGESPRMVSARN